ncbi:MAG: HAD family phosphatase [Deltaproteobacteria bacterium]|nr:HAD family phosphatase [Deltaproteobacteria bacterium]
MLKAIFWDNDGVLVDTEHLYYDATRATLAEIGVAVSEAQFIELSLRQGRSIFDLARERLDEARIEALRQARNARYAERLRAGVAPLPGVEAALAALHGRARLAVVTSSNHDHFEIIHASTGLLRWFDFAITNRDYARSKPHPDPYETALARAGCSPDEAIAIEDSERGLAAAHAAGLRCIVVPRGLTHGGDFSRAYRVVPDAAAVVEIVTPLLSR